MHARFRLNAKDFFRQPFYDCLVAVSIIFLIIQSKEISGLSHFSGGGYGLTTALINGVSYYLSTCVFVLSVIFSVCSYEFIRSEKRRHLSETFAAIPEGRNKSLRARVAFLLGLSIATALFAFLLGVVSILRIDKLSPPEYFWHNYLCAGVLYALLPAFLGVFIGAAWAKLGGRVSFYLFLTVFAFLSSQLSAEFYSAMGYLPLNAGSPSLGIAVQKLLDFCFRLKPVFNGVIDSAYGITIEPYRWFMMLFWITLSLSVLWLFSRKRILSCICFLLCLVCAAGGWYRGSDPCEYLTVLRVTNENAVELSDMEYEKEQAAFSVCAYEITLTCLLDLRAEVTATLDGTNLREYKFTLYHGYRLAAVTDGASRMLDYQQHGDLVIVKNPDATALNQIVFTYSGKHPDLYANWQGIFLPGYFCWYPMEGCLTLTENGNMIVPERSWSSRTFSLRVSCGAPVYTNLETQEDGSFLGSTVGVTVAAGMYTQSEIGQIRYLAPWGIEAENIPEQLIRRIEEMNETWGFDMLLPSYRTIIYSPNITTPLPGAATGTCVSLDDTLLVGTTYAGSDISAVSVAFLHDQLRTLPDGPVKDWLTDSITQLLQGDITGKAAWTMLYGPSVPRQFSNNLAFTQEENHRREVGWYLYQAIDKRSAKDVLQQMYLYLKDGGGDDLAFAMELAEGE